MKFRSIVLPSLFALVSACSSPPDADTPDQSMHDAGPADAEAHEVSSGDGITCHGEECQEIVDCIDARKALPKALEELRACESVADCAIVKHPICEVGGELALSAATTPEELDAAVLALEEGCPGDFAEGEICSDAFATTESIAMVCQSQKCRIAHDVTVTGTARFEFDGEAPDSFVYDLYIRNADDEDVALEPDQTANSTEVSFEITATVGEGPHVVGVTMNSWGLPMGETTVEDWNQPVEIDTEVLAP